MRDIIRTLKKSTKLFSLALAICTVVQVSTFKANAATNSYKTYDGQKLVNEFPTIYEATSVAKTLNGGKVIHPNGSVILDKANNISKVYGYTLESARIRSTADLSSSSNVVALMPKGAALEIEGKYRDFIKVKYYDSNTNTAYSGYTVRYLVNAFTDTYDDKMLGYITERYEAGSKAWAIGRNPNDPGGASYGVLQLASKVGSVDDFLNWLKTRDRSLYFKLYSVKKYANNKYNTYFDTMWITQAALNYDYFYNLQHEYMIAKYYTPLANKLKASGTDFTSRTNSYAVREMLMSTAIQHGVTGAYNLIIKHKDETDIKTFINSIYGERLAIKPTLSTRYNSEKADILGIFDRESVF